MPDSNNPGRGTRSIIAIILTLLMVVVIVLSSLVNEPVDSDGMWGIIGILAGIGIIMLIVLGLEPPEELPWHRWNRRRDDD